MLGKRNEILADLRDRQAPTIRSRASPELGEEGVEVLGERGEGEGGVGAHVDPVRRAGKRMGPRAFRGPVAAVCRLHSAVAY